MFFKVDVASIFFFLIVKNSVFLDLLRNFRERLISWEEWVGEVVLPLMGEEVVGWLSLYLGFQRTLYHRFSLDFYLDMFLVFLHKGQEGEDPY